MQQLIDGPPPIEALGIDRKAQLKAPGGPYSNVVVTGLEAGWTAGCRRAGGGEARCPIAGFGSYYLPAYVNHKSLVIACSYSGNTEETLAAMEQALQSGACRGDRQRRHACWNWRKRGSGRRDAAATRRAPCWRTRSLNSSSCCITSASSALNFERHQDRRADA
jgi:hypothetical protein